MASVHNLNHVAYEERNGVGVWTITDSAAYFASEADTERGESHYRERASEDRMAATVVELQNTQSLGTEMRETLDHINEEWSQLADDVGIDRLAYVADGLMANTVKMQVEADISVESFDSVDEAVEWCRQA